MRIPAWMKWLVPVSALSVGSLLLHGRTEAATTPLPPPAACCMGPLSVGDTLLNSPVGGDKNFFESTGAAAAAMFVLGNNVEMQDLPIALPNSSASGCTDSALVAAMSWFDKGSTDPELNGENTFDPDPEFMAADGSPYFFDKNKFYRVTRITSPYSSRLLLYSDSGSPYSLSADFRSTFGSDHATTACSVYTSDSDKTTCAECLGANGKGWYRGSGGTWMLSGRVLNVRPPKFVTARKVLKDVADSIDNVRIGLATLDLNGNGAYDPAVVWSNPDDGGRMGLSPSCNDSRPPMSQTAKANARSGFKKNVNKVRFTGSERSFGEASFAVGGYFSTKTQWATWFDNITKITHYPGASWGGGTTLWNEWSGGQGTGNATGGTPFDSTTDPSVCSRCQSSAILILADGSPRADNTVPVTKMMDLLTKAGAKHPTDSSSVTFDPYSTNFSGINYCNLFEPSFNLTQCDDGGDPQGPINGNKNFMDEVSFFLAHTDLQPETTMPGKQSVRTYTIGFTDSSPMLRSMALAGAGKFYRADDAVSLKNSIVAAIADLKSGATSFASANISSVQAGGMQASVYVPRFLPAEGRPYEGHLYRFRYYSEFSEGCDPTKAKSDDGDPLDLNGDEDCDDVFFLDKPGSFTLAAGQVPAASAFTALNIVQENKNGEWVKTNTASVGADGKLEGGTPAEPFWDASEVLGTRSAEATCAAGGRCIFTMIDRTGDAKITVADNPPLEFHKNNLADLQPYLLGAGDGFCPKIFASLKPPLAYPSTPSAANREKCAELVVDFVRGTDVFDYDNDGNVTEARPCKENASKSCKLGDIFHSGPIVVDPPVDPDVCTLGLHAQCVMTLFADGSSFAPVSEPICAEGVTPPCYQPTPMEPAADPSAGTHGAYSGYLTDSGLRERFILVGANDGMLHAFLAGKKIPGKTFENLGDDVYDLGTGEEMWALIPADLLPKLGRMANGHEYFVDGTPMVRDVWVDGAGGNTKDGIKQKGEFRTVAVISERGGGSRYMALDVTNPWSVKEAGLGAGGQKPFLWMYPDACDSDAYYFGQSWMNFAPKPPPIGPVRFENSSNKRGWDERWVTFLNGGYSGDLSRGRGVYMMDIWTGEKLWSFAADKSDAVSGYQGLQELIMPVAAAPALLDIGAGKSPTPDQDGFFDTAVVGDLAGQVWTFRLHEPGKRAGGAPVSNWFGARSFEIYREDGQTKGKRKTGQKTPFYSIASNTIQPETGWVRTFLGSGDRQNMRDKEATACGLDNLLACTRVGCKVDIDLEYEINGMKLSSSVSYDKGERTETWIKPDGTIGTTCGSTKMDLKKLDIHCNAGHGGIDENFQGSDKKVSSTCTASASGWTCTADEWDPRVKGKLELDQAQLDALPHNAYFGFHSYGGLGTGARVFSTAAEAMAFDDMRTTERKDYVGSGACADKQCQLEDVTIPESDFKTTTINGKTVSYVPSDKLKKAGALGPGWFVTYPALDEKTAAGSSILLGTVFWPTHQPPAGATEACAAAASGDVGRSWQADYLTGAPDTAESFKIPEGFIQAKARSVSAPPPEPANVISLSKTGEIRYGISITEPGAPPVEESIKTRRDMTSDIYWLEVPRSAHVCRHENADACE